jgi:hypothetical protein
MVSSASAGRDAIVIRLQILPKQNKQDFSVFLLEFTSLVVLGPAWRLH